MNKREARKEALALVTDMLELDYTVTIRPWQKYFEVLYSNEEEGDFFETKRFRFKEATNEAQ